MFFNPHPRALFHCFQRESKGERERDRDRKINVREKHGLVASKTCHDKELNLQPRYVPLPGTEPQPLAWDDAPTKGATQPGLFSYLFADFINAIIIKCPFLSLLAKSGFNGIN